MILFCLRHKPTGRLMPVNHSSNTRWKPDIAPSKPLMPRFFLSHGAAKNAQLCWELGIFGMNHEDGMPELEKRLPERAGQLEIVPMEVKESPL